MSLPMTMLRANSPIAASIACWISPEPGALAMSVAGPRADADSYANVRRASAPAALATSIGVVSTLRTAPSTTPARDNRSVSHSHEMASIQLTTAPCWPGRG